MQVKSSEFTAWRYHNITILSDSENGLFAVQYTPVESLKNPKNVRRSYSYDPGVVSFSIDIEVPKPREVLRCFTIIKTSANCYRVTYADGIGVEWTVVKNYADIHEFLQPMWRRTLK